MHMYNLINFLRNYMDKKNKDYKYQTPKIEVVNFLDLTEMLTPSVSCSGYGEQQYGGE